MITHRTGVRLVLTVIISPTKCAGQHILCAESAVRLASQSYLDPPTTSTVTAVPVALRHLRRVQTHENKKSFKKKKTFNNVNLLILLKPCLKSSFLDAHSKLRIEFNSISLILYRKKLIQSTKSRHTSSKWIVFWT